MTSLLEIINSGKELSEDEKYALWCVISDNCRDKTKTNLYKVINSGGYKNIPYPENFFIEEISAIPELNLSGGTSASYKSKVFGNFEKELIFVRKSLLTGLK